MRFWRQIWTTRTGLLLLAGCITTATQAVEDKVTTLRGETVVGRVSSAEIEKVTVEITVAGMSRPSGRVLNANEIAEIEWDESDSEFRTGVALFKAGNYRTAARRFETVLNDKETMESIRAEARPYVAYSYAESLYRAGLTKDALPAFEKFLSESKTSFYVPAALASLVDSAIQLQAFDKVKTRLDQMRTMGGELRAVADFYEGEMLRAQGKFKDADTKYVGALAASSSKATKANAIMGQARCAISNNEMSRARDLAQKAIAVDPSPTVSAGAHLIIGNVLMAEAADPKLSTQDIEGKLRDALLSFMRIQMMYPGDLRTEPESMFRAGECLQRLNKLPNHSGDRERALTMFGKVVGTYKGTRWAAEAEKSLKTFQK